MATKKPSTENKAPAENDNLNNPPKTEPVSDAEREAKAQELTEQNEAQERVRQANADETPKPTMVNGRYVGDKKLNEETGEWEDDETQTE